MSTLKRKAQTDVAHAPKKPKPMGGSITSFFSSTSPAIATPPSTTNFNKAKWVAGLTADQNQLLKLEIETLHESWLAHLKDHVTSPEFLELKRFLDREDKAGKKVFPPRDDIYSWYEGSSWSRCSCQSSNHSGAPGLDTRLSTMSRLSLWARTHTTT